MAATQFFAVCDSSTFANYFAWASPISAALAAAGWVQSNDTGQVMWSGMNLTAVSMSGSNATYTYNSLTGLPLAVGRVLTCTGMTNAGNNKTVVITSFTGTTSGTFTVVNASGVNESGSTGVVTAQSTVPGSGAYFYEIWQPNDSLTNFYLKIQYGNSGGTNSPNVQLTLSTATNGSGTQTGTVTASLPMHGQSYTVPSSSIPYECDLSGAAGRFGGMMWRNAPNNAFPNSAPGIFAIERSVNASGVYTSSHVTIATVGISLSGGGSTTWPPGQQQTLVFGIGVPGAGSRASSNVGVNSLCLPCPFFNSQGLTSAFNGTVPFATLTPNVGFLDYPLTMIGAGYNSDFAEGVPFQVTMYGVTRTFMPTKNSSYLSGIFSSLQSAGLAVACLRYD